MNTTAPAFLTKRAESVAVGVAEALAASAETSADNERWTARWDAIGLCQPHDPVTGHSWSGINRYALVAGSTVVDGAITGAWATKQDWEAEGFAVASGSSGIVVLRTSPEGLEAATVYNACQLTVHGPADARYGFTPGLDAADIDRVFGTTGWEQDPQLRASQLADLAVTEAGVVLGRFEGWQDPRGALTCVLASQMVVNALGFSYSPDPPSPDVVEEWATLLRSSDAAHHATALTEQAARLAAAVVEQIAARQLQPESIADQRAEVAHLAGVSYASSIID